MTGDMFAAVPDRCPDCGTPMDTEAELTRHSDDSVTGEVVVSCRACGYEDTMTVSGDGL